MAFRILYIVALYHFWYSTMAAGEGMLLSRFAKNPICDIWDRINVGCSEEIASSRTFTLVECLSLCGRSNKNCTGASISGSGKCYLHNKCPDVDGSCFIEDTDHRYMSKYCENGDWNHTSKACDCDGLFHGTRCEKYPATCQALHDSGFAIGTYTIYIDPKQDGQNPFKVLCRVMLAKGRAIMFKSEGTHVMFNKTWQEYVDGFKVDDRNFWGGLDAWHVLTNNGCTRMGFLVTFSTGGKSKLGRMYSNFIVQDANNGYRFTFDSPTEEINSNTPNGTSVGQCLSSLQNKPFSTWDKDRDEDMTKNCASWAGSGWWYAGCNNPCHTLGLGFNYWSSHPSHQLLSMDGIDMDAHAADITYIAMFVEFP